eukprot:maker-scaffold807_size94382-snap-gene-0.21 protein:Tk06573 transcript:maker-scaffold807_size94382-snap-gene-0.21-mRNA-1 annotation:"transmembrane protein 17-like"
MGEMARETIKQVSESMFPGITQSFQSKPPESRLGHEVVTNLSLQMCLFFNVCYFPFWLIISVLITHLKYEHLNYLYKFILITVLVAIIVIEIVRLYLGYLGNLTEKVPELAGFWLLSVLLQFPLQAFLFFNEDLIILPLERAANLVMVGLVLSELITGFIALRKITQHQAKKFHLLQLRQQSVFQN